MSNTTLIRARAIVKRARIKPNKSELRLLDYLQQWFTNGSSYVYNGGQLTIEGKVPDFVCVGEKKKIIELWGKYWHDEGERKERKALFAKYGYDTLFVNDTELKHEDELYDRVFFWHYMGIDQ